MRELVFCAKVDVAVLGMRREAFPLPKLKFRAAVLTKAAATICYY